jgi:hypothetical protein
MKFVVKLKAKSVWTMRKRALIRDALEYANCHLGLYNFDFPVHIRLSGEKYSPGLCCDLGDRLVIKVSGNQPDQEIVETLFHELTHARQYANCDLDDIDENTCWWKGHQYRGNFEDTESKDYWNAPWEVEARQVGEELRKDYYQI